MKFEQAGSTYRFLDSNRDFSLYEVSRPSWDKNRWSVFSGSVPETFQFECYGWCFFDLDRARLFLKNHARERSHD